MSTNYHQLFHRAGGRVEVATNGFRKVYCSLCHQKVVTYTPKRKQSQRNHPPSRSPFANQEEALDSLANHYQYVHQGDSSYARSA